MVCPAAQTIDKLEAFPGAEGYGRYTTGGRGGKVYHVTTLEDNNKPGSFRYACNQSGARTIVFDVSGNIHLTSALNLSKGNVTIAGQTAPGDGICITDYPFSIKADNVIIRFVRFRLGNKNVTVNGADGWDALGALDRKDIIIDHCSVSWSIDECLSFSGTTNTTVQWCIVSQSLVNAGHSKGGHGYGGNWGGQYGSYHHNLLAHHTSRAPRLGPRPTTQLNEVMDMRNNVMFNYSGESCYGGEGMNVNIVNNYYQPGPGNKYKGKSKESRIAAVGIRTVEYCLDKDNTIKNYNRAMGTSLDKKSVSGATTAKGKPAVVIAGKKYEVINDTIVIDESTKVKVAWNSYGPALHLLGTYYVDGNNNYNLPKVREDNWAHGMYDQISAFECFPDATSWANAKQDMKRELPIEYVYTTTHSAEDAYANVLAYAGASLKRDALDAMVAEDAKNNTVSSGTGTGLDKGFINTPNDVKYPSGTELDGVLPLLKSTEAPVDTDGDGMPDEWEKANGLDPENAADGSAVSKSGYTNLEVYINSLVQEIMDLGNANGKMLNGELTFADDAVELPVYSNGGGGESGDPVGETVDYIISKDTYKSGSDVMLFSDGFIVSNASGKGYGAGGEDCIKYSAGVQYTVKIPEGLSVTGMTIYGYNNYDGTDSSFSEINGQAVDYIFPKQDDGRTGAKYVTFEHTFAAPVSGSFTFTPVGKQVVLKLTLHTVKGGDNSAIQDVIIDQEAGNGKIYNIMGIEVSEPLLPGIYIRDGKKFIVR
ncbi:MAG: hypothetical protein NC411_08365 [Bacteroides sp.]|nr:hypothetical protein [Bacteroides sp.]